MEYPILVKAENGKNYFFVLIQILFFSNSNLILINFVIIDKNAMIMVIYTCKCRFILSILLLFIIQSLNIYTIVRYSRLFLLTISILIKIKQNQQNQPKNSTKKLNFDRDSCRITLFIDG